MKENIKKSVVSFMVMGVVMFSGLFALPSASEASAAKSLRPLPVSRVMPPRDKHPRRITPPPRGHRDPRGHRRAPRRGGIDIVISVPFIFD